MENNNIKNPPYAKLIIDFFPILLSSIDKSNSSLKLESFDINYRNLKIINNLVSPISKYNTFSLAMLYNNNFEGNSFYQKYEIKQYVIYAIKYWFKPARINQFIINLKLDKYELIIFADLIDAFLLFKDAFDKQAHNIIISSLIQAGIELKKYSKSVNESTNAIISYTLYLIYLATNEYIKAYTFKVSAENRINNILINQNKSEGWFYEYGGCDPAYLSITIEYLAKYYKKSNDSSVIEPISKTLKFMSFFCHPDNSFGGEYGSRNGNFLDPVGLEISTNFSPHAKFILDNFYTGLINNKNFNPFLSYDQYSFFFLNKYLEALLLHKPFEKKFEHNFTKYTKKYFSEADIGIRRNQNYYCVISLAKGGLIKLFNNNKLLFNDFGYFCKLENNSIGLTQLNNREQKFIIDGDYLIETNKEIILKTFFFKPNFKTSILLIKLYNCCLGKIHSILKLLNLHIKNSILNPTLKKLPILLERKIFLEWYVIKIVDKITILNNYKLKEFNIASDSFLINSFFTNYLKFDNNANELDIQLKLPVNVINLLNKNNEITITKTFTFSKDDTLKIPETDLKIE